MSARRAPPDELSSLEEEKLLRNDNSPNDVSSSHLRRIRYSQFNSVSVVFRAVIEVCMEVPWTERQSDNSNLSERSRKEL
ncbi:hypothetical protein T02_1775 [Trichinella nativa]|uniref:Uncharacterized protein n=1 Tax=Trichinella nativa TaxID=6335 RepID=A0A0V1L031_9BILA|nr:hypothetical protein T02_1775 [Trichinella nativa]